MYPNAPNIEVKLLAMDLIQNSIGSSTYLLRQSKDVIGINLSITSNEHYQSKRSDIKIDLALKIQSFLYDGSFFATIKGSIYKVERTYQSGQFVELYLTKTKIDKDDIIDYA